MYVGLRLLRFKYFKTSFIQQNNSFNNECCCIPNFHINLLLLPDDSHNKFGIGGEKNALADKRFFADFFFLKYEFKFKQDDLDYAREITTV